MKTHVAAAASGHAKRPVAKELKPHGAPGRAADVLFVNGAGNTRDLLERELAGEHGHVGVARVKAQRGRVGDVELR